MPGWNLATSRWMTRPISGKCQRKMNPLAYHLPGCAKFTYTKLSHGRVCGAGPGAAEISFDRTIQLEAPEERLELAVLLRDEFRFGIQAIHHRLYPQQQVTAVSTDRLHTIARSYVGKDDPVAVVRTQGIFPAPEEVVSPYFVAHYVAGDARGSHHMPLMPVAINTAVAGPYCLPLVACMAYSVTKDGRLSEGVDMFGNVVWDETRFRAQRKGAAMRQQGFFGPAMLPIRELEYSAFRQSLAELEERFTA